MKKAFKIILYIVATILLIIGLAATYIHFSGIPTYPLEIPVYPAFNPDSTMVAEGKRLSTMVCAGCHMSANGKLEGKSMLDLPAMFGKATSANITNHPTLGIGRYTNDEIVYLLRTGIKRDGRYTPPWMPKFPHLSDLDMQNLIAYLRSDAPELSASDKINPKSEPSLLIKVLCRLAFKPLPFPPKPIQAPAVSDKVAFGKYLVTSKVDCYGCHSPSFQTQNIMQPEKTPGYMSGGNPMPDLNGTIVFTRNLTPDKETGIGSWSENQFVKTLRSGIRPNGKQVKYPMMPYAVMTEEEASAIWAYLQSIPAIKHDVEKK